MELAGEFSLQKERNEMGNGYIKTDAYQKSVQFFDLSGVDNSEELSITELMEAIKILSEDIAEELEHNSDPTRELMDRLEELKSTSTKFFEYMADDVRYRELFEE